MSERQTRDLEVRVRIPVQVQIFLLKFMKMNNIVSDTVITLFNVMTSYSVL